MLNTNTINIPHGNGKSIVMDFSGGNLSSDAGLMILKEIEEQVGIIESLANVIPDHRHPSYTKHTIIEMLTQRISQIAAGYEDANDCNDLRNDPIFKLLAGRCPLADDPLSSQPTMSRLENSISNTTLYKIAKVFLDQFIASYAKPPEIIVLDFDDTEDIAHGDQQLSMFNNYYKSNCFLPMHLYEGLSGKLITTILKPGQRCDGEQMLSILKRIIECIRQHWHDTIIVFRGDSHFTYPEVMEWIDSKDDIFYVTGLTGNSVLYKQIDSIITRAGKIYGMYGMKTTLFHSFYYQAGTWDKLRRVVAKVEISEQGKNIRFIVTNMEQAKATVLYRNIYCARGQQELYIKEHKLYLKSDRTSCHRFQANQFRLFLHSAAYVLIHALRTNILKHTQLSNASIHTIRVRLFKVAALVTEFKTRIKVQLPTTFPLKDLLIKAFDLLLYLRTT